MYIHIMTHYIVLLGLLALTVVFLTPMDVHAGKLIIIDVGSQTDDVACDGEHACFIPYSETIFIDEEANFYNADNTTHTIVFGIPTETIDYDAILDRAVLRVGQTHTVSFDKYEDYQYYCHLHPWMTGVIQVRIADIETLHDLVDELREEIRTQEQYIEELEEHVEELEDDLEFVRENFEDLLE